MKSAIIALAVLAVAATGALLSGPAGAQPFPARPIRLIVPGSPGAGADVPARFVAQALGDDPGWRVVVENRAGASGRIGAELVAKSPADGYTLLMGGATPNAVVHAAANVPYDTLRDFAAISLVSTSDFILVAHPSLPATTVKELIVLARSRPGEIRFGSVGNLSGAHVTGELLKQLARINIVHVPYNGGGPAMVAVLSGETELYFGSGPSIVPHANTGKLRLIATTGPKRSRMFPSLPTVGETVPGHEATLWYGVLAPAATPKDILARLHAAVVTAGRTTRVIQQLTALGQESVTNSPEEFTAFIRSEIAKWSKVVKISGTTVD
jgi:tripartite-type tricarboxylate transporter receptor subunit TctC